MQFYKAVFLSLASLLLLVGERASAVTTAYIASDSTQLINGKEMALTGTLTTLGVATPLLFSGIAYPQLDVATRDTRGHLLPHFRYHYDDYLQYLPLVAGLSLTLVSDGVYSPKTLEQCSAYAFAGGFTALSVLSIKKLIGRLRPDGSSYNSFPSGHTATAYLGAELLDLYWGKQYPWMSMLGYATAFATANSRVLNNRHWLSDTYAGMALGILSADLGYLLASKLWKSNLSEAQIVFYNDEASSSPTLNVLFGNSLNHLLKEETMPLPASSLAILYTTSIEKYQLHYGLGLQNRLSISPLPEAYPFLSHSLRAEVATTPSKWVSVGSSCEMGIGYPLRIGKSFFAWHLGLFVDLSLRSYRGWRVEGFLASLPTPFRAGCAMGISLQHRFSFSCSD